MGWGAGDGRMKTVIVTGSRYWDDAQAVYNVLDDLLKEFGGIQIVHGGAKGADTMAGAWAEENSQPCFAYPAMWREFGKAAGYMRNLEMLKAFPEAIVVAFPHPKLPSKGTWNMMNEALKQERRVITWEAWSADRSHK